MADPAASAEQDRTLDRLEQQSEADRARFARSVDQLRSRVSPNAIQADLKQRASHAGRGMLADLERKVLDNPLQTAAVGAGLAYPVWQLLRNLPAPILLLGAGVALAGRGSRADQRHERSYRGGTGASSSSSNLSEAASATSSAVHRATDRAGEMVSEAVDTVQRTAASAMEQAGEFTSDVRESASRTTSAASNYASSSVAAAGRAGREGLNETVERYPLVVGAVGVLLGAALAACIPSSRTENRLFGETSERVKDQARETAAQAYDEARAAGERIVENTMDEAREQGLTPQDAEKAMKEAGSSARAVADRATQLLREEQASPGKTEAGKLPPTRK